MILLHSIPEHQAYDTHLNYIKCLASLMKGTDLQYSNSLQKAGLPDIDQKKNLIALTKKSLSDEKKLLILIKTIHTPQHLGCL